MVSTRGFRFALLAVPIAVTIRDKVQASASSVAPGLIRDSEATGAAGALSIYLPTRSTEFRFRREQGPVYKHKTVHAALRPRVADCILVGACAGTPL